MKLWKCTWPKARVVGTLDIVRILRRTSSAKMESVWHNLGMILVKREKNGRNKAFSLFLGE